MALQIISGFGKAGERVKAARVEYLALMQAEAVRISAEAGRLAREGVDAGVYATPPGKYVRTGTLQGGTYSNPRIEGTRLVIEVGNTAPYASEVEWGTYGGFQGQDALTAQAQAKTGFGVLYLGRSGKDFTVANPAITRATVVAGIFMAKASSETLRHVLGGRP